MKTLLNVKLILGKVNDLVDKVAVNLTWMMLLAITLLNIVQVFYRYVLNNALSWSEEASLWMMVWITFIILPLAYRRGLNISMMFFRDKLGRNRIEYSYPLPLSPHCYRYFCCLFLPGRGDVQEWNPDRAACAGGQQGMGLRGYATRLDTADPGCR